MELIKNTYIKYKEIINYLIFGVLSMIVNFGSYLICTRFLAIDEVISSGISWFVAVMFAYITNKIFVFESNKNTIEDIFKEMVTFFLARIVSGVLCDVGTFALMVRVFKFDDVISKMVTQVMVVIANYIFSKWIIFKK